MVAAPEPHPEVAPQVRRFSRSEYDQMVATGMFDREKLELIRGLLVQMSPQGREHGDTIEWLYEMLAVLAGRYRVRSQLPFAASDDSEPEPDFAVARLDPARGHTMDVLLLIEVAMSSIRYDRGAKLTLYAEVGVPEYWIVDVEKRVIEVYTGPSGDTYERKVVYREGDVIRPMLVPELELAVANLPRLSREPR